MDYIKYFFLFLGRFILFPVYALSGLFRRRQECWVFGSWGGHRFADNAAVFFLYCQQDVADEKRLVWITRDRSIVKQVRQNGFESHYLWSPQGILACLTAGTYVFDCYVKDINFWLSRGARKVNLWSGVPLKVFERDIDVPDNRYFRLFHGPLPVRILFGMMMPWHLIKPDLIVATSDEMAEITGRAFAVSASKVHVTGFPRNDMMIEGSDSPSSLKTEMPSSLTEAAESGSKVFLYLPTFRDSNKSYMNIDWSRLSQAMRDTNGVFFYKTHPMDKLKIRFDIPSVIELPQSMDVYDALPFTDVLISDYSSIIFDYMLLEKPIIYYTPDLEEFVSDNRSLNFQPEEIAVGPLCPSFEDLLATVVDISTDDPNRYASQRTQVMPRVHKFSDGKACHRILALLRDG